MAKAERDMYVGKNGISHLASSRKGQLHKVFDDKGADDMVKAGRKMGLSESTIRTCLNRWGGAAKAKSTLGAAPKVERKAMPKAINGVPAELEGFNVDFRYRGREQAEQALHGIADRNSMMPECFNVGERGGKYGVVPRHKDPDFKPPEFVVGMRVANMTWPTLHGLGTIEAISHDGIVVKWDDGVRSNSSGFYLEPQRDTPKPGPKKKAQPKHEPEVEAAKAKKVSDVTDISMAELNMAEPPKKVRGKSTKPKKSKKLPKQKKAGDPGPALLGKMLGEAVFGKKAAKKK